MRVRVDRQKCEGHNRCNMACPEVYKTDDQQYAYVDDEQVPESLQEKARRAAEECPEGAIAVIE